ncbi:MAG: tetratricopeptide repeat protein [Myxococcota bacterium]|nr:tetratricopeptide repeat protein [Myxococcota bacterium]MEC8380760.1 tetratricopeptide repeat protein [Myxococcota bacterium]
MKYSFSTLLLLSACDLSGVLDSKPEIDTTAAENQLSSGQFPNAASEYNKLLELDPTNSDAATGAAYLAMLRGDYEQADAYLEAVQKASEAPQPEILMRRSLIAQQSQELDKAKNFALESGLDSGKLLASEIMIVDGGLESAVDTLKTIKGSGFKSLADDYLELLESDDDWLVALAEIQAQWAAGERTFAVEDAPSVLQKVSFERYARIDEIRLTWATRALSLKKTQEATSIIELPFESLEESQKWRVSGIKFMISCVTGDEQCITKFDALEEIAPPQGYADMRITTAYLLKDDNPALSRELLADFKSASAALVFEALGAHEDALSAAQGSSLLSNYLKEK